MNHKESRNSNKHINYYFKCKMYKNTNLKKEISMIHMKVPPVRDLEEILHILKIKRKMKTNYIKSTSLTLAREDFRTRKII